MLFSLDGTEPTQPFPAPRLAERWPNGLLAMGGDLSIPRLLNAYRAGIFPWFNQGEPILWWSPDPRLVLFPQRLHLSRSLRKRLRRGDFLLRFDQDFPAVIAACAAPRQGADGTWIVPAMVAAYEALFAAGHAHCVAVWQDDRLVGGLYGVALGRLFFGESMFSRVSDASKVALACLSRQLERWDFHLIDCQVYSDHLASLGAEKMRRADFTACLHAQTGGSAASNWPEGAAGRASLTLGQVFPELLASRAGSD